MVVEVRCPPGLLGDLDVFRRVVPWIRWLHELRSPMPALNFETSEGLKLLEDCPSSVSLICQSTVGTSLASLPWLMEYLGNGDGGWRRSCSGSEGVACCGRV